MKRTFLIGASAAVIALALACGKAATPVTPEASEKANAAAAAEGTTLKIGAPTLSAPPDGFQADLGSTAPFVLTLINVNGTYATFTVTYEFEIKNPAGAVIQTHKVVQGTTTTAISIPASSLIPDTIYTWRARATFGTAVGPWSPTRAFTTAFPQGQFGQTIIDPLTDGTTVGKPKGGRFVPGEGWQALLGTDGLDYDIPTCTNCTVEFDATNFGLMEGQCCAADLKWLSMGDATTFTSFGAFRDHEWKMHFIQRADNDGLEIIWRNGGVDPEGNPGDHRIKYNCCGPKFQSNKAWHFVITWTPAFYDVKIGEVGQPVEDVGIHDGFGGLAYAPPNHRISLGCYPRGESIQGIIYRNVKVYPNK